jgi:F-box/WD-40 domain protein MET30
MNEWSPDITPIPESRPVSRQGSAEPENNRKRPFETGLPSPVLSTKRICSRPAKDEAQPQPPPIVTKQPWKDVYKTRFKVGTNWKYGRGRLSILKGHTNGVTCLQFRHNIMATGSWDTTIKIWDMEAKRELRTLHGHTLGIRCLQFDEKQLVSGALDGTIRVWDWRTGELQKELKGPTGGVLGVHFDGNYLAAGSQDHYVYIWNTLTTRTYRLGRHTDFVNSVKLDVASRTVFSASDDQTICLWDLDSRSVLRTFRGHTGPVQQVLLLPHEFNVDESDFADHTPENDTDTDLDHDDEYEHEHDNNNDLPHDISTNVSQRMCTPTPVSRKKSTTPPPLTNPPLFPDDPDRPNPPEYMLTAGLDSTIRLWHVPTGRCLRTLFGHLEGVWAIAADTLRVVSGAEDKLVKVWDVRTGKCEKSFAGHTGPVICVGLSGDRLVSGGEDCEVRVMEFGDEL